MIFDDTMKEMTSNEPEVSVDRCQSPLHKRPPVGTEVGDIHVRVMQICDGDLSLVSTSCPCEQRGPLIRKLTQPVMNPKIRLAVY